MRASQARTAEKQSSPIFTSSLAKCGGGREPRDVEVVEAGAQPEDGPGATQHEARAGADRAGRVREHEERVSAVPACATRPPGGMSAW